MRGPYPGMSTRDGAYPPRGILDDPTEIKPFARSGFHGGSCTECRSIKRADVGRLYWGRPDAARRPTPRTVQSLY